MTLLHYRPMRRVMFAASCLGLLAGAACSKKTPDGLPPATEWQAAPDTAASATLEVPPMTPPRGMGGSRNPHAGLDMQGDPTNPHAGVDMDGDPTSNNPHLGGGTDVTKLGLAAPDPDRPIDPSHRVTGMIGVDAKAKDRVKPGTSVFLIVKRAGPDGAPSGPTLAVDKLTWSNAGVPFELTDAQAMVAGTELSGNVIVMARYDQDSDALSKEPGDITGQVSVKIPADHVKLTLDTILP